MPKYHINPETGRPNQCTATVRDCKYAENGTMPEHYDSKDEARTAYEKQQSSQIVKTLKKKDTGKVVETVDPFEEAMKRNARIQKMEEQIIYKRKRLKEFEKYFEEHPYTVDETFEAIPNDSELLKQHNQINDNLRAKATVPELEAVRHYTGIGYIRMNKFLYDKEKFLEDYPEIPADTFDKEIALLDSYIDKADKVDKTVYRVMDQDMTEAFDRSDVWAELKRWKAGEMVMFKNYSSTSSDPAFINHYLNEEGTNTGVVFVMKTDKGATVGETVLNSRDRTYTQQMEREILLPRDITFKITKVSRCSFNNREGDSITPITIFMEEI